MLTQWFYFMVKIFHENLNKQTKTFNLLAIQVEKAKKTTNKP